MKFSLSWLKQYLATEASADEIADFYKGKSVNIVVGHEPATGFDIYARVLARHKLNLQLAKVSTLGERVEDTFLIDGPELQQNKRQIEIETELLQAITA